jgi:hypothetical protein
MWAILVSGFTLPTFLDNGRVLLFLGGYSDQTRFRISHPA